MVENRLLYIVEGVQRRFLLHVFGLGLPPAHQKNSRKDLKNSVNHTPGGYYCLNGVVTFNIIGEEFKTSLVALKFG